MMKDEKVYRGPCPCGSLKTYEKCCQPWHEGRAAPDAEALMRSRYTAFVLKRGDYLLATWHPSRRPASLSLEAGPRRWLGLKVLHHEVLGPDEASVTFVARYKAGGRSHDIGETSRFVREDGRWFYVDGEVSRGE